MKLSWNLVHIYEMIFHATLEIPALFRFKSQIGNTFTKHAFLYIGDVLPNLEDSTIAF